MLKRFVIIFATFVAIQPVIAIGDIPISCDVTIEKAKSSLSQQGFQNFVEQCSTKSTVENVGAVSVDIINAAGDNVQGIIESTATSLSKAARELGITINEFITTPAGMLIVLVSVLTFVPKWVIVLPVCFFVLSKLFTMVYPAKYEYTPYFFGLLTRKKVVERQLNKDFSSDTFLPFVIPAVIIIFLIIVI